MKKRRTIPKSTETEVLTKSRRRCCICFGLSNDIRIKTGQIAHLDKDCSNNNPDNLAFLCLKHHDEYDSRTSQSKGFTEKEVKKYREDLFDSISQSKKVEDDNFIVYPESQTDLDLSTTRIPFDREKELEHISSTIKDTINALEGFSFKTTYKWDKNNKLYRSEDVETYSGKNAIHDLIKFLFQVLHNNLNSQHQGALKKDSLDIGFPTKISKYVYEMKYLFESILSTIEIIRTSNLFQEKNKILIHNFKNFFRFLNMYIVNNKNELVQIAEEMLPDAIILCEIQNVDISDYKVLLNELVEVKEKILKVNTLIENLSTRVKPGKM